MHFSGKIPTFNWKLQSWKLTWIQVIGNFSLLLHTSFNAYNNSSYCHSYVVCSNPEITNRIEVCVCVFLSRFSVSNFSHRIQTDNHLSDNREKWHTFGISSNFIQSFQLKCLCSDIHPFDRKTSKLEIDLNSGAGNLTSLSLYFLSSLHNFVILPLWCLSV